MSSSDDEDPYDFVAQFKKIQENRKNRVVTTNKSSENIVIDDKKPVLNSSKLHKSIKKVQNKSDCGNRRSRRRNKTSVEPNIIGPVICIGDFDDDYDIPPSIVPTKKADESIDDLMTNWEKHCGRIEKETDDLVVLTRVINVKVFWRSTKTYRFPLRMFQSIESIYEHFAKLENIEVTDISLKLHGKGLSPSDTPNSIDYKIVDFIDGDIEFFQDIFNKSNKKKQPIPVDEICFKIKQQNVKHPILMSMKKTDTMQVVYVKLSEKLDIDLDSIILRFDGDKIGNLDTIETLDLEGGECFDLFIKK